MFGYLFPTKEVLSLKERKIFRDYFCTLCFAHKYRYGEFSRFLNNFDIAIFAIIFNIYGENIENCGQCCKRVEHRKEKFSQEKWKYVVDFNINLVRKKIEDDLIDQPTPKSVARYLSLQGVFLKARKKNSMLYDTFNKEYFSFHQLEKSNPPINDILNGYEIFSKNILAATNGIKDEQINLYLALNKWIYWIDSVNDFDADIEKGSYNPYVRDEGLNNKAHFLGNNIFGLIELYKSIHYNIISSYNKCTYPIANRIIIENIINYSIPNTTRTILENGSIPKRRKLL
jgi:hypothetical protein